ncbi:hypothetical protein HanRHA438_Chr05g0219171 [Helianthus annuus]|nr:hypothetical protein HanRHA438_Chr05g0219171 [Helianthus annuus]
MESSLRFHVVRVSVRQSKPVKLGQTINGSESGSGQNLSTSDMCSFGSSV